MVAEVEVEVEVRVKRLWIAVDVGLVVNPDGVVNQIEGGAIQAASWTLKEEVKFTPEGIVCQGWEDYPILKFSEVPAVDVEVINRPEQKSVGAGEAPMGPTAAAIANAVRSALGVRVRDLPISARNILHSLSSEECDASTGRWPKIRGFYRLAAYALRWGMIAPDAQQRLAILGFWQRHGLAAHAKHSRSAGGHCFCGGPSSVPKAAMWPRWSGFDRAEATPAARVVGRRGRGVAALAHGTSQSGQGKAAPAAATTSPPTTAAMSEPRTIGRLMADGRTRSRPLPHL